MVTLSQTRQIILTIAALMLLTVPATASPVLWTHDSVGKLGTVDLETGEVWTTENPMGTIMTDIAYDPEGNLWGISFTGLYTINPLTAETTLIGEHNIKQANALVFGNDGTLYAAGGGTFNLYTVDPATAASTSLGFTGFLSAGDLAFYHGNLYLSSSTNQLVRIDLENNAAGTAIGSFGFTAVYGLATADDDTLYGISFTTIFSVDTSTGLGTPVLDFKGRGLGASYGSSFITESLAPPVPLPHSALLLGSSLAGMIVFNRLRKKTF